MPGSELERSIDSYLAELARADASPHTLRNYETDLRQFLRYFSGGGATPPTPADFDHFTLREWLADLHTQSLERTSIRRKLAAIRSFFTFLLRQGVVSVNRARLLRTPKVFKKLPVVPTEHQTNTLIDEVAADTLERPHPSRDLALFELLYGCGLRISELVSLDPDSIDFTENWIRVLGKGKKVRQVPIPSRAAAALTAWLDDRRPAAGQTALFLNHRGTRLTVRGARGIVKLYSIALAGDASLHPHTLRHAYATPPAQRRRRPPRHPGTARPRVAFHHPEIHPGLAHRPHARLRQDPPAGVG